MTVRSRGAVNGTGHCRTWRPKRRPHFQGCPFVAQSPEPILPRPDGTARRDRPPESPRGVAAPAPGRALENPFGGLVLNSTDNLTGNILTVTSELGTLGLPSNVLGPMANLSLTNGGAYAAPRYQQPQPAPPWWESVGEDSYNLLGGVADATGLATLVSIAWNGILAAAAYVGEAYHWLEQHTGLEKLSQIASGLKLLASAMKWALDALISFAITEISMILNMALSPFYSLRDSFSSGLADAVDPSGSPAIWLALSGPLLGIGLAVAVALEVAMGVVTGLTLGSASLISILVGLVLSFGIAAIEAEVPGASAPSSAMVSACESTANEYLNQSSQAGNWTSWADAFVYWEAGTSNAYAFQSLRDGWADESAGPGLSRADDILRIWIDGIGSLVRSDKHRRLEPGTGDG